MRKSLFALLVVLLACTGVTAQAANQPMFVTYEPNDPTTLTCRTGYHWINTVTKHFWGCDIFTSTWIDLTAIAATPTYPFTGPTGCAAPPFGFSGDADAGVCLVSPGNLRVQSSVIGSVNFSYLNVATASAQMNFHDGTGFDGQFHLGNDLARIMTGAANAATFTPTTAVLYVGGVAKLSFSSTAGVFSVPVRAPDGTSAAPGFSFGGLFGDGVYKEGGGVGLSVVQRTRFFADDVKIIPDATPTTVLQVAFPSDGTAFLILDYVANAVGVAQQSIGGTVYIAMRSASDVETCSSVTEVGETSTVSAGSITFTATCDTSPTAAVNVAFDVDSSNNDEIEVYWTARFASGIATLTPQ